MKIKKVITNTSYYCNECSKELQNRHGTLYHPKTRLEWFSRVPINCSAVGKYFDHPDLIEVTLHKDQNLRPNDL